MQPAQSAFFGQRMIVLNKSDGNSAFGKFFWRDSFRGKTRGGPDESPVQ
jgi:hypothetical protein